MKSTLKYGDIIMLFFSDETDTGMTTNTFIKDRSELKGKGFLASPGFLDKNIYINSWKDSFDITKPIHHKAGSDLKQRGNYRDYLFKITPKCLYNVHSECENTLSVYKQVLRSIKLKKNLDNELEEMKVSLENRLRRLSKNLEKERRENEELLKLRQDEPITFGSEVQLYHYNSQSFINVKKECEGSKKIGYICELSKYFSKRMVLKILPKLKSRIEGEFIQYNDQVYFQAVENGSFLSFNINYEIKNLRTHNREQDFSLRVKPSMFGTGLRIYKSFFSSISEVSWYVIKFSEKRDDKLALYGQDLITLKHAETGSLVSSQFAYHHKSPEVYLRADRSKELDGTIPGEALFEIEHVKPGLKGEKFMFRNYDNVLVTKFSWAISLKHFVTGKEISLTLSDLFEPPRRVAVLYELEEMKPQEDRFDDFDDEEDEHSLSSHEQLNKIEKLPLFLYPTFKLKDYVSDRMSFYISNEYSEFLKCDPSYSYNRDHLIKKMVKINPDRDYLEDEAFNERRLLMTFTPELSTEDTFIFTKVSEEDRFSALFIKSSFMVLYEIVMVFYEQRMKTPPSDVLLSNLESMLDEINRFIFGLENEKLITFDENKNEPNQQRQRLLKDIGFLDYIMDIIYLPFKNNFYQIEELTSQMHFTKVLRCCYSTLRYTIQEYRPNELYASQWLEFIINHSLKTHKENDINAGQAMRELIDNNRKILEYRITSDIIMKYIKILGGGLRDSRYTNILRAICICNNQAMIHNQKMLSEMLLEDKKASEVILVPIKNTFEGEIQVYFAEEDSWINIMFLKGSSGSKGGNHPSMSISQSKKHQKVINMEHFYRYFISLINLLSDLCYNRNYLAIDFLNKYYPLELCVNIITDLFDCEIREAFCTLTRHLWINVSPYYEIKYPNKIKLWEDLNDGIIFSFYNGNVSCFDKLKQFIPEYIENYLEKSIISDEAELNLFKSVMETLLSMFQLGLYREIKNINKILKCLTNLLNKEIKVLKPNHQQQTRTIEGIHDIDKTAYTYDVNGFDSIKAIACKIIRVIIKLQNEIRINNLLFKIKMLAMTQYKNQDAFFMSRQQGNSEILKLVEGVLGVENSKDHNHTALPVKKLNYLLHTCLQQNYYISLWNSHDLISLLLNLTISDNLQLKTEAINILYDLHSKQLMIRESVTDLVILDLVNSKRAYKECQDLAVVLRVFGETSEKWYFDCQGSQFKTFKYMLDEIEQLLLKPKSVSDVSENESRSMAPEELTESVFDAEIVEDLEIDLIKRYFIMQRKLQVDPFYQSMFRHLGVFASLFEILKDDLETNDKSYTMSHKILIERIYFIFACSCINDSTNKQFFRDYLKTIIMPHFTKNVHINGISIFLFELLNDSNLSLDKKEVTYLTNIILMRLERESPDSLTSPILINSMKRMVTFRGFLIEENQNIILKMVISKARKNILVNFKDPVKRDKILMLYEHPFKKSNIEGFDVYSPGKDICYIMSLISLLNKCSEDSNSQTENICQIILPYKFLKEFILMAHANIIFKLEIAKYLFNVHLDSKEMVSFNQMEMILPVLIILARELKKFSEFQDPNSDIYYNNSTNILTHDGVYTYKQVTKEYLLTICDIFLIILLKFNNIGNTFMKDDFKKIVSNLMRGSLKYIDTSGEENKTMFLLFNYCMTKTDEDICKELKHKLRRRYNELKILYFPKKKSLDKGGFFGRTLKRRNTKMLKIGVTRKLDMKENKQSNSKNLLTFINRQSMREFDVMQKERANLRKTIPKTDFIQMWIREYFEQEDYLKNCEKEFQELIKTVMKMNDSSCQNTKLIRFFTSMSQFLLMDYDENTVDLINIVLRIYIKFITGDLSEEGSKDQKGKKNELERHTSEVYVVRRKINYTLEERQNILIDIGILEIICESLSKEKTFETQDNLISLAINLLEGGNIHGQKRVFDFVQNDRDNKVLMTLKKSLDSSFELISKEMASTNDEGLNNIIVENEVESMVNQGNSLKMKSRSKSKLDDTEHQDEISNFSVHFKFSILILRFLQLLCEGHNLQMQNLLRTQDRIFQQNKKVDFIAFSADILRSFVKFSNVKSLDLGQQLLDFILETVQGPCKLNQDRLIESKIIDVCKDLVVDISIKKEFNLLMNINDKVVNKMNSLIKVSIRLLNSLMEGRNDKQLFTTIAENLRFDFLMQNLVDEFMLFTKRKGYANREKIQAKKPPRNPDEKIELDNYVEKEMKKEYYRFYDNYRKNIKKDFFDVDVTEGFGLFFFMLAINEETGVFNTKFSQLKGIKKLTYDFFKENSRSIEIVFEGILQRVYFVVHPACWFLSTKTKKKFLDNSNRDSSQRKLKDFMKITPKFIDEMEYMIDKQNIKFSIFTINEKLLRDFCFISTLLLNIGILIFFRFEINDNEIKINPDFQLENLYFTILGVIQSTTSFIMLVSWVKQSGPLVIMDAWRKKCTSLRLRLKSDTNKNSQLRQKSANILKKNVINQTYEDYLTIMKYEEELEDIPFHLSFTRLQLWFFKIKNLLISNDFKLLLMYFCVSVVAFTFQFIPLYSVLLIDITHRFDMLKNIFFAITHNSKQILLTILFDLIIIYIYALFAYYYVSETFFNSAIGDTGGENMCISVWKCFLTIFSLGPRSSGGIGDMLVRQSYNMENRERYYIRFFYDVTCFMIVNVVFMNIIFGIIIDAFAVLRDENEKKLVMKENICFVCSLDRSKLEKNGRDFATHTKVDHDIWNYLYYIYFLLKKDHTEYDGIESYVAECINKEEIKWFPIKKSLAISVENSEHVKNFTLEESIDKMLKCIEDLNRKS